MVIVVVSIKKKAAIISGKDTRVIGDKVYLHSLIAAEHDVRGYALDAEGMLGKVKLTESLNPSARGFRALKIKPMN